MAEGVSEYYLSILFAPVGPYKRRVRLHAVIMDMLERVAIGDWAEAPGSSLAWIQWHRKARGGEVEVTLLGLSEGRL